jgi:hypothetical protein
MKFDTSPAGLDEALKKVLAVAKYLVVTMITVGLGLYIKNQQITLVEVTTAMSLAGANLVFVFLQKWLTTTGQPIS